MFFVNVFWSLTFWHHTLIWFGSKAKQNKPPKKIKHKLVNTTTNRLDWYSLSWLTGAHDACVYEWVDSLPLVGFSLRLSRNMSRLLGQQCVIPIVVDDGWKRTNQKFCNRIYVLHLPGFLSLFTLCHCLGPALWCVNMINMWLWQEIYKFRFSIC